MQPISAVIITFNEETNIERCITSLLQVADEIIVLDSYSTDQTVAIAKKMGAVVHQENFRGYIGQKNLAMQLATHDYVLSLDADESLDSTLAYSILEAKKNFSNKAFRMNRCTSYCGRFMRHGLWYPDKKIRLFDRRFAKWGGLNPHDKIHLEEHVEVKQLKGDILHHAFDTVDDLIWRNNRISTIAAVSLHNTGKRSNLYRLLIHPTWAFINGYLFRGGFLDGFEGFSFAVNTAHQVFLKYSKLYRLQNGRRRSGAAPFARKFIQETKSKTGEG
jgi:glycosyltransferase involved in cell wall biosynthesis